MSGFEDPIVQFIFIVVAGSFVISFLINSRARKRKKSLKKLSKKQKREIGKL